jgi:hypothetical protein
MASIPQSSGWMRGHIVEDRLRGGGSEKSRGRVPHSQGR